MIYMNANCSRVVIFAKQIIEYIDIALFEYVYIKIKTKYN